nr:hypothetical protein [uncultured Dyadobacter sp.]
MNTNQLLLPTFFFAIVIATWVMLYKATKAPKLMWLLAFTWFPVQIFLSNSGFYLDTTSMPPHFAFAIVPPLIFIASLAVFRSKKLAANSSLKYLTLLHTIRVAVELALFCLFQMGEIPRLMTFEGSNPDIISGITSPLIWLAYRNGLLGRKGLIVWNIACLGLLLNIVARAILSAPTPFQQLAFDQPNVGLLKAPYVLLPAFIVPAVLFSHVAAMLKLASGITTSLRDLE